MDCDLEQRADGLWHCKADCGRRPYPKKVRQQCGQQAQPQTCPECGEDLVRKQRLPEGKWYWRCPECRVDRGECRSCNART